ncbi:MAG: hypothetical protein B7Y45_07820 [Sphingomonas sp. 28-66-16]|nr:MAG: hypothetical protein B7Y45_07820 [Sphingomonas sp. 28-66-16]
MSAGAESTFHRAMLAALRGATDVGGAINGVFDGPATKASAPYAELGSLIASDWGTKDRAGRELRTLVMLRDRAEAPARLYALAAAADAAITAIDATLGDWRIASLVLVRSQIVGDRPGEWTAVIEHRVRLLAA